MTKTTVTLSWSQPNLNGGTLSGYQINYTTPYGTPQSIIKFNTGNATTVYKVSGLSNSTNYSFRVGIWTNVGLNPYGNIVNVQTLGGFTPANFNLGSGNLNATNPVTSPIKFTRTDVGTLTNLLVTYSNSLTLSCNFAYTFATTNHTYTGLSRTVVDANTVSTGFTLNNTSNDIINVYCYDASKTNTGRYVITQSINNIPLVQQVQNFRNGTYGTLGMFGALDLVTLFIVIISMIGFNRVNDLVGVIFNIIIVGIMAFFGLIQWPTIVAAGIIVVLIAAIIVTRRTQSFA